MKVDTVIQDLRARYESHFRDRLDFVDRSLKLLIRLDLSLSQSVHLFCYAKIQHMDRCPSGASLLELPEMLGVGEDADDDEDVEMELDMEDFESDLEDEGPNAYERDPGADASPLSFRGHPLVAPYMCVATLFF